MYTYRILAVHVLFSIYCSMYVMEMIRHGYLIMTICLFMEERYSVYMGRFNLVNDHAMIHVHVHTVPCSALSLLRHF